MQAITKTLSILQAWPQDVLSSVRYVWDGIAPLGAPGETMVKYIRWLPPRDLVRSAFGPDERKRDSAMRTIATDHASCGYYPIGSSLMSILRDADAGEVRGVNVVLRRALLLLRDEYVNASADDKRSLASAIAPAYAIGKRRHEALRKGHIDRLPNLDLLLILVGLQRVAEHPAFDHYKLEGPAPRHRSAKGTFLSLSTFVAATMVSPYWLAAVYSAKAGVSACFLSLAIGGAVTRWRRGREDMSEIGTERPSSNERPLLPGGEPPQRDFEPYLQSMEARSAL